MDSLRAESNEFKKEMQKQKNQMQLYENSISKLQRQNGDVQSQYERYLSSTQQELSSLRNTIRKQQDHVNMLENKNNKLEQDSKTDISELTRHSKNEKEHHYLEIQRHKKVLENAQQARYDSQLKMGKLELRIKQTKGELQRANETIKSEKSRNAVLSKERTQYNESSENLRILTEELDSERLAKSLLLKERIHYKGQVDKMKALQLDLEHSRALLKQEHNNSEELRNTTERSLQLEGQLSDLKTSEQVLIEKNDYLNNEVKQFSNVLEGKDVEIGMLKIELLEKDQEIKERVNEIAVLKEKHVESQELVSDLQTEINQYKSNLNAVNNSNLQRERDAYQRKLMKACSELKNATENNKLMERMCSDLKTSKQALGETVHSLNKQMRELAMGKESEINNLNYECQRKGKDIENTMTELSLIKEQNKSNEQLVTDLQVELGRYKSNLKEKDSDAAKMILNLRREVETYQIELNQAQDKLRHVTENTFKKSEQAFIDETGSLNDKIRELTNMLKRKNSDVRKMETKMAEISSIEEKNTKLEQQVTDLQIEVNQYKSALNDKSFAYTKLTDTISNLRHEMETYQSEINQARDELKNATEKTKQMERKCSDLKKSNQAFIDETGSLKDKIRELTNILKINDSDVRKMEKKTAEISSIEEKNNKLEQQVTDLQIEVNQYRSDLNDKSSATANLTNTISNLRREAETYQSEVNQARDELKNATEKTKQMERMCSELKNSDQAFIDETGSLKDKIRELTNILKRKDSDVREMEEKMAELSSIEETNNKLERQVTDLQIEVNQYKFDLNDKSSASTELANTITNLRREVETYRCELIQTRDELRSTTEKTQQMERKISVLKKSQQVTIDERGSINDNVRELTNILRGKDSHIQKIETKLAELSLIKEENVRAERQVTDLQIEMQKYKSELKDESGNLTKLTNTISNLCHESENCKSELKEAHEKIRKFDLQLKTVSDEHENCKHLISSLRKENEKLSMCKVDQARRSEATLSQREHELSLALEKSRREFREVQHEIDDTKTRLSKVMEQKRTDNNPNIAELSDINRPTKLSERYSELYDNQWPQAFDVICKQLHDEQSTIETLIGILMNAAKYCREEAMTQLEAIQGILLPRKTGSTFPSLLHKNLNDFRKVLGEQTGAAIYEKYIRDIAKQRQQSLQLDVKPYVKECVELCWLMSIQDPPVVVAQEVQHGENFDTDFYKAYTKSGPLVDFVVWPALCLHENGPLLCKGIAQGYGGKNTKLSKVMGQKLTDNNPNIADLSDKNRPTKLAERYSELYDNQWTDAFEVVNNQLHDEKSTIDSLSNILLSAADFCQMESEAQMTALKEILIQNQAGSTFPSLVQKNLKDCRKALGEQTGAALYKKYIDIMAGQQQKPLQLQVKPFVKECIELCWLMSIQDPPVVIGPKVEHGTRFDTDFYKAYTKSGPFVDFVVWPALCLHVKGALLCKGIAQGYGGKRIN
ncbi:myosin-1B-like [Mya arenaria]|uniref:myosin-1B-like n=1 Tax=Mya arenaria TaxID=6604 RepID=UPI0022DFF731|nr:myosin-1B-like [Mya arenaria]